MAWDETNRMSRQNISRMAEVLGGMKQSQAGMMQQNRLAQEEMRFQGQENQRNRLFDALKTAGTMAGDYLSKKTLAEQEEGRLKARYSEGGWMRNYDDWRMGKEDQLQRGIMEYQNKLEYTMQEDLYGKGGLMEGYEIRGEKRQEAAGERTAEANFDRQLELMREEYKYQKLGRTAETEAAKTAATTAFQREKELIGERSDVEVEAAKEKADYEQTLQNEMYDPTGPYMQAQKKLIEWEAMAKQEAELYFLRSLGNNPALLNAYQQMRDSGASESELSDVLPSLYIQQMYAEYAQKTEEGKLARDKFEAFINLRLNSDKNVYGEQFIEDVKTVLPQYMDEFFGTGDGGGGADKADAGAGGHGFLDVASALFPTPGSPAIDRTVQAWRERNPNSQPIDIGEALKGEAEGVKYDVGRIGQAFKNVAGGLNIREQGGNVAEQNALTQLRSLREGLDRATKRRINEFIREIGDNKTVTPPERLAEMIEIAKRLGSSVER